MKTVICVICQKEFNSNKSNSMFCKKFHSVNCYICGKGFEKWSYNIYHSTTGFHNCKNCQGEHQKRLNQLKPKKEKIYPIINCQTCNKPFEQKDKRRKNCSKTCGGKAGSSEQAKEKGRKTRLDKYGNENFNNRDKAKQTYLKNWGVTNSAKHIEVKKKQKETYTKNHGGMGFASKTVKQKALTSMKINYNCENDSSITHNMQIQEIKDKIKETTIKNHGAIGYASPLLANLTRDTIEKIYGVRYPLQSEELRNKTRETWLKNYGVDHPMKIPEICEKMLNSRIENNGEAFITSFISNLNKYWKNLIEKTFKIKVSFEKRLENKFFDLYIEDLDILIEINPTITHNSTISFGCIKTNCSGIDCKHKSKSPNYHQEKSKIAMKNNLTLIHIYDWDKEEKILNLLEGKINTNKNKISAHKCNLQKITQKEANLFSNKFHIQGSTKGQSHCYGLFHKNTNELLAITTFGKSRFGAKEEYEFIRYAVNSKWIVYGASQKLFNQFIKDINPNSVVSYIDFNHTTKKKIFLNSMGFKEIKNINPQKFYYRIKDNLKVNNNSLLNLGADKILGTTYGKPEECQMNNHEIMIKEGFLEIYTSGTRKFVWKKV